MKYTIGVIICAAGKGARTGFSKNKLLVPIDGVTPLFKTLSAFDFPTVDEIVVTSNPADYEEISTLCQAFPRTSVVLGGETRSQSVYNALKTVKTDIILIHDGARPFVTRSVIDGCIQSVKTQGSGVCAVAVTDTVAVCENSEIIGVPNRESVYAIQTPQGFFRENILTAYERAFATGNGVYTDDSSVFAKFCGKPRLCAGARDNIKLTYADDFRASVARCGFGVDTHAFGKAQDYIVLAGVKIPAKSGLIAHSDGDVLCHAVMDALLSAAGLRDIGFYFPDKDEQWKNANSMQMLALVMEMLQKQGFAVKNLSIAVQAEQPRLAGYIDEMKNRLASVLRLDPTAVGISAGTNEGLGYIGEGKGITVNAYALLKEI